MSGTTCPRCKSASASPQDRVALAGICPSCLARDLQDSLLPGDPEESRPSAPLQPGTVYQGYEILEVLGRGGMGIVYRARHQSLGRVTALKMLAPRLARSEEFVQRFEQEAKALASLNHPNVVRVYGFGREADLLFLAMEFVEGRTLEDALNGAPAPDIRRLLAQIAQVCDGLDRVHQLGLIHRDIKPANILLSADGTAKLTDFGIAIGAEDQRKLTETGTVLGTPHYMSPEQIQGHPLDARSDLYSLGVVLYAALTGKLPFEGASPAAVLVKHLEEKPPPPRTVNPKLSAGLEKLVLRLLAKNVEERPRSAAELGEQLRRWTAPPNAPQRQATTAEGPARPPRQRNGPAPVPGRRLILLGSLAGIGALVLVAVLVTLLSGNGTPAEEPASVLPAPRKPSPAPVKSAEQPSKAPAAAVPAVPNPKKEAAAVIKETPLQPATSPGSGSDLSARLQRGKDFLEQMKARRRNPACTATELNYLASAAREQFEAVLAHQPANPEACLGLSLSRRLAGDTPGALEALTALASTPGASSPAILERVRLRLEEFDRLRWRGQESDTLRKARRELTEDLERLEKGAENVADRSLAGVLKVYLGNSSDDVARALTSYLDKNEGDSRLLACLGKVLLDLQRHPEAEAILARGENDDARNETIYALRARLWLQLSFKQHGEITSRLWEKADADYTKALEINPRVAETFYDRGRLYGMWGRSDGAIQDFDRAIALNPQLVGAYSERASAREDKGDYAGAWADLTAASKIEPRVPSVFLSRGIMRVAIGEQRIEGLTRGLRQDLQDAVVDFDEAIRLDPRNSDAYRRRAAARQALGRTVDAIKDYTSALVLDPSDWKLPLNRGKLRLSTGDLDGGVSDLNEALQHNPGLVPALKARAEARQIKGDVQGAKADRAKAAELMASVDLLRLVDLKQDTLKGVWTFSGSALEPSSSQPNNSARIPYMAPQEYDLTIVVESKTELHSLALAMSSPRGLLWLHIDLPTDLGRVSGLNVDRADYKTNPTLTRGPFLMAGKTQTITYSLRRNGVQAAVDGRKLFDWQGDFRTFYEGAGYMRLADLEPQPLRISCFGGGFSIKKCLLTPVSEPGRNLR